ncbi:hypothetical protein ILUMI_01776 [Ignelater luminosus]|uniref:CRAL-TRIO domain-containing protein n=1 Tax=Ignelater luminosus TaxID=2038154 RepID=A0A8K0DHU3_IGNLU|nr:hypothetical protein ILUMI_01776 [Ignelater luminosus]
MSKMEPCVETGEDDVPFVQLGQYKLRLDLEDLDEEFRERSRIELRETPEVVEKSLARLKELLEAEEELNLPVGEDEFFMKFLRPCKFYTESAFRLLTRFYKFKAKHPELAQDLIPANVRHVFEQDIIKFLPNRCQGGTRIMLIHSGAKWNPKVIALSDLFRTVMMALEIAMIEPKTQVAGVHVILDMQGLTLNHVWQFSPSFAKTVLEFVQECTPVRLKGIHVVNQPFIFKMLYAIFKPFIGEKLKRRLFFHGYDRKSLHSRIPKEDLPACYDGTLDIPDYPGHLLAEMLCRYDKEFELCNVLGYVKEKVIVDSKAISTTKLKR